MKRLFLIVGVSLLAWGSLGASESGASGGESGTCSAQFLKLGAGGRAMGMGGAFVGLANDVTAVYWNPAGLAGIGGTQLAFMHQSVFQDISYEYFACAQPLGGSGVLGGGIAYLHMDKLVGRDEWGEFTSDFASSDLAVALSYGHRPRSDAFFGVTVKFINEKIEDEEASAFVFDLGCLYRIRMGKVYLGGVIQNLGQDVRFVSESYGLPRLLKLGAAYADSLGGSPINLVMDLCLPSDNDNSLHLGAEYVYRNVLAARMGYGDGPESDSGSRLSFGLGVVVARIQTYRLDYAFVPGEALGDSHTISLLIQF